MHLRRCGAVGPRVGALPRRSAVPAVAALRSPAQHPAIPHRLDHVYVSTEHFYLLQQNATILLPNVSHNGTGCSKNYTVPFKTGVYIHLLIRLPRCRRSYLVVIKVRLRFWFNSNILILTWVFLLKNSQCVSSKIGSFTTVSRKASYTVGPVKFRTEKSVSSQCFYTDIPPVTSFIPLFCLQ